MRVNRRHRIPGENGGQIRTGMTDLAGTQGKFQSVIHHKQPEYQYAYWRHAMNINSYLRNVLT